MSAVVNGWIWDEESQRWYVMRGTAMVTCRRPENDPPQEAASLFGVQLGGPQ